MTIGKVGRLIGVDRAVAYAVLARGWAALSGILSLALLVRFLTPFQQGYYAIFGSFMAAQVFLELGLSLVLMQFASHERAGLTWTPQRTLTGDPLAKARLAALLRRGLFWYAVMALAILAFIYPAGVIYFRVYHYQAPGAPPVAWEGPWLLMAVGMSIGLMFTPLWAILEGCGLVAEVVSAQFVSAVLGSLMFWTLLLLHWGLYAASVGGSASTVWVIGWLAVRQRGFLRDLLRSARPDVQVDWRREVWPFQWKIALSWLSGYFVFETFVPLLFALRGPVPAGQMGLSLSIAAAISAVSLSWVATKAAPFGSMVARRDWAQMDRVFFPCLWQSTGLLVLGGASFWLLTFFLHQHHLGSRFSSRLLPPLPLALLLGATLSSHILAAEAIYLRAHRQEPLLLQSLLAGAVISLLSWLLGRPFGATGMMAGYLIVSLVFGLGLGNWVFIRKRREWHAPPPRAEAPAEPHQPLEPVA